MPRQARPIKKIINQFWMKIKSQNNLDQIWPIIKYWSLNLNENQMPFWNWHFRKTLHIKLYKLHLILNWDNLFHISRQARTIIYNVDQSNLNENQMSFSDWHFLKNSVQCIWNYMIKTCYSTEVSYCKSQANRPS